MQSFSIDSTTIRRVFCTILLGTVVVLLSACDTSGPSSPEPQFKMDIGDPVNTSLNGAAALGSDLSFDDQSVFVHPGPFGKTITVIQLFGETDQGDTHDLSFMNLADGLLEPGTYDVGTEAGPGPFPDEHFTASYGRQTPDSLHFYPLESGTVTIETATEESVEGTFSLNASLEASVSRAAMEAFRDSLFEVRGRPPSDNVDLPRPPEPNVEHLETSMTISGSFTATSGQPLSDEVTHLNGFEIVNNP